MKLLIITGIFPPDIGGPATYVPPLAAALAAHGHQVTVFTLSDSPDPADSRLPFPVIRQSRRAALPLRVPATILHLLRLGRRADLLFVNGLALEAALANLVLRKPLVLKVVGDLAWERAHNKGWVSDDFERFQTVRYGPRVEALKALRAWWTRRATRIIAPSRYLARWVAGWGVPESKVRVIYNAVDSPNGIPPAPLDLTTRWRLVTVGRLVAWKRVERVIAAIVPLPDVGLVVVGDGPEREKLTSHAARLGVAERVRFLGQKSHAECLSLMRACHLFVLNSSYEGLPHVVLEAMSLGLPVVASAAGGTPEIIKDGENGRLVSPDNDNDAELGRAIRELLSGETARRTCGDQARLAGQAYGMPQMLAATESELSACLVSTGSFPIPPLCKRLSGLSKGG